MKHRILLGISIFLITISSSVWANAFEQQAAKEVIENWFAAMKEADVMKAGTYLSPQFVSIHTDGIVRNKEQELNLIKNLHMKNYKLTDFQYAQNNDTIVITYKDEGSEKIDGKSIEAGPAGRMAVLQKDKGKDKWIIIAYANLDKIN